jgi:cell division protein FtsB
MNDTTRPTPSSSTRASLAQRGRRLVRYVLGFITVVLVIDAIAGDNGLLTLLEARRDSLATARSLEQARQDNDHRREEARRLREDPSAIEELARRELGLIKPGEKLFIIRDVPPQKK